MRNIWFIRHGESESNAGLPSISSGSPPLTLKGREQALHASKFIQKEPDLIVTSSFIRTQETAAPTIEKFPNVPRETWPVEEFTYLSSPSYLNTTIPQRRSAGIKYWRNGDPDHNDGPGAESFNDLFDRVHQTFELIEKNNAKFILVFSHGWFMRAMLYTLFTHANGKLEYLSDIVRQLRKDRYISSLIYAYFSIRKIPPEKRKMLHYLAFASTFQIPNTAIMRFESGNDDSIKFIEKHTDHLPASLRGNFILDR